LTNVLARRVGGGPEEVRIARGARLEADRCTFVKLTIQATPGSVANFRHCIVTGEPKPEVIVWKDVTWSGAENAYDVKSLRVEHTAFGGATFADFQKLIGGEDGSQWGLATPGPTDLGADVISLRKLIATPK
jgi:hypothetical protein